MNYTPYTPYQQYGYQPQPVKEKTMGNNFVEVRVLNENENVDTLYVQNKTLFINDRHMILKGIDGSLEKWEISKIYPIDPKDQKIRELENQIKELKEMIESASRNVEHNDEPSQE